MLERDQVALFLALLRQCAACDFRFERRPENMATLARLGIRTADVKSMLLALSPADYVEGAVPRPERSDQEAWVFEINVKGEVIYAKVSIRLEPARCVCVSFHEPKWELGRPYRDTSKAGECT